MNRHYLFSHPRAALCGAALAMVFSLFLLPAMWAGAQHYYTVRDWVEVQSVSASNAVFDQCPIVTVNRTIKSPVQMSWVVSLDRRTASGWVEVNTSPYPMQGISLYKPDDALPSPMYLPWWLGGPANNELCPWLEPGTYRMVQEWTVVHPFWSPRPLEIISPEFIVVPEDRCADEDAETLVECLPRQRTSLDPDGCRVRASQRGIYHVEGSPWYDRVTSPVDCFTSAEEAAANGYREAGE